MIKKVHAQHTLQAAGLAPERLDEKRHARIREPILLKAKFVKV
jgi:hypothetical protein